MMSPLRRPSHFLDSTCKFVDPIYRCSPQLSKALRPDVPAFSLSSLLAQVTPLMYSLPQYHGTMDVSAAQRDAFAARVHVHFVPAVPACPRPLLLRYVFP